MFFFAPAPRSTRAPGAPHRTCMRTRGSHCLASASFSSSFRRRGRPRRPARAHTLARNPAFRHRRRVADQRRRPRGIPDIATRTVPGTTLRRGGPAPHGRAMIPGGRGAALLRCHGAGAPAGVVPGRAAGARCAAGAGGSGSGSGLAGEVAWMGIRAADGSLRHVGARRRLALLVVRDVASGQELAAARPARLGDGPGGRLKAGRGGPRLLVCRFGEPRPNYVCRRSCSRPCGGAEVRTLMLFRRTVPAVYRSAPFPEHR